MRKKISFVIFLCALSISLPHTLCGYPHINESDAFMECTPLTQESLTELTELQRSESDGGVVISHLVRYIHYAPQSGSRLNYVRSILKFFGNVVKGKQYIPAHHFSRVLDQLLVDFDTFMHLEKSSCYLRSGSTLFDAALFYDRFKAVTNNLLYVKFSTEYTQFKTDPDKFLELLSHDIMEIAREEVEIELLKRSLARFLDICISKLVWCPYDKELTWNSVRGLADQLSLFVERNILTDVNDLDDLYWSIIHRYCFFLDVAGTFMPPSFYQSVRHDIATQPIILLELEEQDQFVERKTECLQRALTIAEARSRAQLSK